MCPCYRFKKKNLIAVSMMVGLRRTAVPYGDFILKCESNLT